MVKFHPIFLLFVGSSLLPARTQAAEAAQAPCPRDPSIPLNCVGEGWTFVSVEGLVGSFCAKGPICSAANKNGNCPSPQDGLDYGSTCGKLNQGNS
uniref:Kazal-like domain-containing protein n=1 Tax=Globisporangium ultimum (strain ATCC 200006 / CBS 805.95 / DAOM BR144) TaxID=431595 RepID=K3WJK5_GLOUD